MERRLVADTDLREAQRKHLQRHGRHQRLHCIVLDPKGNADFLRHCEKFSYDTWIDGLGGERAKDAGAWRRHGIPEFGLEDVIHQAHTGISTGIQLFTDPVSRLHDYDKWEGGYIQGFSRMDGDDKSNEFFVWQIIPMYFLEDIVEPFKDKLIYWE